MTKLAWVYDDGGRKAAGYKGMAGDCVTRAVAIAAKRTYQEVYAALNTLAQLERSRPGRARSSARNGVRSETAAHYLRALGFTWTPTMGIGTGCRFHLAEGELPPGRLVVSVSHHWTAVINGVIFDTHDPTRDGTRCVYGYWMAPDKGSLTVPVASARLPVSKRGRS